MRLFKTPRTSKRQNPRRILIGTTLALLAFSIALDTNVSARARKHPIDPDLLEKAKAGDPDAEFRVASTFAHRRRLVEAHAWYLKAAQGGIASAMTIVATDFETGRGVHHDAAQAFNWYQKAAETGDPFSVMNVGRMYENGLGTKRDFSQAAEWYTKAADAGNLNAQIDLANLYENRIKDDAKAVEWYEKAAQRGDIQSQYRFALHLLEGSGIPQDTKKAMGLLNLAALRGDSQSQFKLGQLYENGGLVKTENGGLMKTENSELAKTAEKPDANPPAASDTGGIPKDMTEALFWYRLAAGRSNVAAQAHLGSIYENGEGVPQDFFSAYYWTILAFDSAVSQHDTSDAKTLEIDRDRIAAHLKPPELPLIEMKAKEWLASQNPKVESNPAPAH